MIRKKTVPPHLCLIRILYSFGSVSSLLCACLDWQCVPSKRDSLCFRPKSALAWTGSVPLSQPRLNSSRPQSRPGSRSNSRLPSPRHRRTPVQHFRLRPEQGLVISEGIHAILPKVRNVSPLEDMAGPGSKKILTSKVCRAAIYLPRCSFTDLASAKASHSSRHSDREVFRESGVFCSLQHSSKRASLPAL